MNVQLDNPIFEKLGMTYPIIQGGMAWAGTGQLAGSVSEAGGLGIIGTGYWHADQVRTEIQRAREITDKPFGVNVMLMSRHIREVFDVIIEEGVKVVATGAGDPAPFLDKLHEHGIIVIPVVPSVGLAKMMEKKGVDAVVAEGAESGGHIGSLSTMTLVPQVVDAVDIPVIAAGGIADGRGAAAAIMLGASGIQMGTRFLASDESEIHQNFKDAVVKARDIGTVVTGELMGNRARVLKTPMAKQYIKNERVEVTKPKPDADAIEELENGSLKRAVIDGDKSTGAFMAGEAAGMVKDVKPVADILSDTWTQASELLNQTWRTK